MQTQDIFIRPIITEKSMGLASKGSYTFQVNRNANKNQLAEAVSQQFGVTVIKVRTVKLKGKVKRFGSKRKLTKLSDIKKAIVSLKSGQKIDLFDIKKEKNK